MFIFSISSSQILLLSFFHLCYFTLHLFSFSMLPTISLSLFFPLFTIPFAPLPPSSPCLLPFLIPLTFPSFSLGSPFPSSPYVPLPLCFSLQPTLIPPLPLTALPSTLLLMLTNQCLRAAASISSQTYRTF